MVGKKLLCFLFGNWSLLWMMAGRIPGAHSARLKLQSTHATFYGGPDASVTVATPPTPAPTTAPIINDEYGGPDTSVTITTLMPAPMTAPIPNDEYGGPDATVTIATPPTQAPTPAAIINDDKKEDTKAENDSKLLIACGYPCCGTNYHGPCSKCCSKGPPDINDVEKATNGGGGVGHV